MVNFGLSQVIGKKVAVGGKRKSDNNDTNQVYTYDERSKKWKQTLSVPPMTKARCSPYSYMHVPGVLSLQSALVACNNVMYMYTIHFDLSAVCISGYKISVTLGLVWDTTLHAIEILYCVLTFHMHQCIIIISLVHVIKFLLCLTAATESVDRP